MPVEAVSKAMKSTDENVIDYFGKGEKDAVATVQAKSMDQQRHTMQDARRGKGGRENVIKWGKLTTKCLDYTHQDLAGEPGMRLQIWECPRTFRASDRFKVPHPGEYGLIQPVEFPWLCLQTVDSYELQFLDCSKGKKANKEFIFRKGDVSGYHHIHLAVNVNLCMQVADGNSTDGTRLHMWKCQREVIDEKFHGVDYVHDQSDIRRDLQKRVGSETFLFEPAPVDCEWDSWMSWSSCSVSCGVGSKSRYRPILTQADFGGLDCEGAWTEATICKHLSCNLLTAEVPFKWVAVFVIISFLAGCVLMPAMIMCLRDLRRKRRETQRKEDEESQLLLLSKLHAVRQEEEFQRRRDEDGWYRMEAKRLEREEMERRTAEVRKQRVRETSVQTQIVTCPKRHALKAARHTDRKWICDGSKTPAGCRSGITTLDTHAVERFRCDTCDHDLCKPCYEALTSSDPSGATTRLPPPKPSSGRSSRRNKSPSQPQSTWTVSMDGQPDRS